ncbi:MAG: sigma-70 family RNA polymerase sigma factor [Gemmatimonadales bacterium]|nr:MAG: sigma-70 family RNA polymerase sigma factor [Gemmatimonadales bacterium]
MSTDWARIYETTWDDLVRYLDRKVWDPERARDLAQEAFVRALRSAADPDSPRAWLFTVAGNLARDEARSAGRRKRHLELITVEAAEQVEPPDGADDMELEGRRSAVRAALDQLSERDREILLLWDAGLSYTEIAEESGLSMGAIGTTLARARRRLVEAHHGGGEGAHVAHN